MWAAALLPNPGKRNAQEPRTHSRVLDPYHPVEFDSPRKEWLCPISTAAMGSVPYLKLGDAQKIQSLKFL